jgi:hypothetical protein
VWEVWGMGFDGAIGSYDRRNYPCMSRAAIVVWNHYHLALDGIARTILKIDKVHNLAILSQV